ncbi:MAG: HNH endonuclease [Ottowia sp.]|nr:HNH endonuclease [Ottowia sp.]
MPHILGLDIAGRPFRWLTAEQAILYNANGKVVWDIGEPALIFRGGINRHGQQSIVQSAPIIAVGRLDTPLVQTQNYPPLGGRNDVLFQRDRHICAYCGQQFCKDLLTRDHVVPRSRGGQDTWANLVAACRHCNHKKGARTPEEAAMPLLYLPYAPCRFEHFILSGRNILLDQMMYLTSMLPRHSRMAMH